jgi:hypothetical protein
MMIATYFLLSYFEVLLKYLLLLQQLVLCGGSTMFSVYGTFARSRQRN